MGRRLDVLLGRTTKQTARLKSLLGLAVTRLAVLRGHRQVRCAQARGDVEQLLRLGHADRALLRAGHVIREQDTLDAFLLLESYCGLVADRAALVDAAQRDCRGCPEELREAAAGLVYAAARCGDLPELQEVRALLAAKLGRDFASAAAELRGGCGINTKIVQKLSTKEPSLESRTQILLEIAAEKEIPVRLPDRDHEEDSGSSYGRKKKKQQDAERHRPTPAADDIVSPDSALRYKDVEAAAQAAFESAATAAAAAKAAIELSRADHPDDRYTRKPVRAHVESGKEMLHGGEDLADEKKFEVRNYSSEVEDLTEAQERDDDIVESKLKQGEQRDKARSRPASVRTKRGF